MIPLPGQTGASGARRQQIRREPQKGFFMFNNRSRKWLVLSACILITFVCSGMCYAPRGLYTPLICAELGLSRTAFNLSYSVASLVGLFVISINFARLRNALGGYRNFILCCLLLYVVGCVTGSLYNGIVTVYISSICIYLANMACGGLTLTAIVVNWFPHRFGTMLGLILAGTTLGGAVFSPFISHWIAALGWRTSYRIQAVIVAVCVLYIFFTLKEGPDGAAKAARTDGKKAGFDRSLFHNRNFYLIGLGIFFLPFGFSALPLNAPSIMQDAGNSVEFSGTITSIMLTVTSLGKVFSGWLNDKVGVVRVRNLQLASGILGVLCLIFAGHAGFLYAYSILFGFGYALAILYVPFHVRYAFPDRDPGEVMGMLNLFSMAGGFVANPVISFFYERLGSYTPILIIVAVTLALTGIFPALIRPERKKPA